ncbi:MAG TPA: SBBP repeat-containing protein [bacterium]|jgi:hypothetical protein
MRKFSLYLGAAVLLLGSAWGIALAQVSQEWVARYDGPWQYIDEAVKVIADEQGYVYVTGSSYAAISDRDYLTIKYNADGVELWTARFDGGANGQDITRDMAVDAYGNVYVTGAVSTFSFDSTWDWGTVKYDPAGNQLWAAYYQGPLTYLDHAYSLAVDSAQNVYVVGITDLSPYYETANFTTIKYDQAGNVVWNNTYDSGIHDEDRGKDIALDQEGNVCVVGYSMLQSGHFGILTIKYNSAGARQWLTIYDGEVDISVPLQLTLDGSGNVFVATTEFSSGAGDYFMIKYNPEGVQQWTTRHSSQVGSSNDFFWGGLAVDEAGDAYLTGSTTGADFDDMTTVKFNSAGELQWAASETPGVGKDVAVDGQGNVYATGGAGASYGGFHTLKYDSVGQELWEMYYSYSSVNPQMAISIALDSSRNVFVTGQSKTFPTNTDYATVKYAQDVSTVPLQPQCLPKEFVLYPPSPNPFNPSTALSFELRAASPVSLKVYDTAGRLVATLVDGWREAGIHETVFDGSKLPSGIYLARLTAGDFSAGQKLVLMK